MPQKSSSTATLKELKVKNYEFEIKRIFFVSLLKLRSIVVNFNSVFLDIYNKKIKNVLLHCRKKRVKIANYIYTLKHI